MRVGFARGIYLPVFPDCTPPQSGGAAAVGEKGGGADSAAGPEAPGRCMQIEGR